jgi:hypothetical protein
MTHPVSGNNALIPRRPQSARDDDDRMESREQEPVFTGYAPPGAEWHARVRRLGGENTVSVAGVSDDDQKWESKKELKLDRIGSEGVTLKIEAEVTLHGKLPPEGVAVETVTVIRNPEKGRDKR